jgi:hypothetical protein
MVASVMMQGWSNVPSVGCMGAEGGPVGRFFVEDDFGAWRCERCGVEVEVAVNGRVCGETGIEARGPEEVQSDCRMW